MVKLEKTRVSTRLYRKVDGENMLHSGELCFSTPESVELISHGDFCLVLREQEYSGLYFDGDIDAGKNFGYDEFRVKMTEEELKAAIEVIIVPDWWEDDIEEDLHDTEEDPYVWMENLREYGRVLTEGEWEGPNMNFPNVEE